MTAIADIVSVIEQLAPPQLQESYDNSGLIIGAPDTLCRGVLLTLDVTEQTIAEAVEQGCNLIVAHHPLIFRGLKRLNGTTPVERGVIAAIKHDVAVYAAHTSFDNARQGMSWLMAEKLGLHDCRVLKATACGADTGSGVVGSLDTPLTPAAFVARVKEVFGCEMVRCTAYPSDALIERVALCGGSGAFLIEDALSLGAHAYVTADVKYHEFADYANRMLLIDAGHYETEHCITQFFSRIISEKFPNFAVKCANTSTNPVIYM